MKLKCTNSKTNLFKNGKTYDAIGSYRDDEYDSKVYIINSEINSFCHVTKNCHFGTFKEITDVRNR